MRWCREGSVVLLKYVNKITKKDARGRTLRFSRSKTQTFRSRSALASHFPLFDTARQVTAAGLSPARLNSVGPFSSSSESAPFIETSPFVPPFAFPAFPRISRVPSRSAWSEKTFTTSNASSRPGGRSMIAMEEPKEVARIRRRESFVKRREEEPVPRVVGRAAERDVEKVFWRRGEISPFFCAMVHMSASMQES